MKLLCVMVAIRHVVAATFMMAAIVMPIEAIADKANVFFIHGANVSEEEARADVQVTVCDEYGAIVSNAEVVVSFLVKPTEENVSKGQTNDKGVFSASCDSCIGRYTIRASKEGYYETFVKRSIKSGKSSEIKRSKKWFDGEATEKITLRPVRMPVKLQTADLFNAGIPATNETLKLDLQTLKWCPPYGDGRHDDVHLVYRAKINPHVWLDFSRSVEIYFPHSADGFYLEKTDGGGSRMRHSYAARTNEVYRKKIAFSFSRTEKAIVDNVKLADDEYLVFRTRTQTNENGRLVSANYGFIAEKIKYITGLDLSVKFNSCKNDPNLEDAQILRRQKIEQKRRAK
jgi:hypothetical protein